MSPFARILADPKNLALRQVVADELQEQGDPRGQFIAHQLECSKLDSLDPRLPALLAESLRLESANRTRWLADIIERLGPDLNPVFRNGFLSSVRIDPGELDQHWPWLAAREPIEGVEVVVYEALSRDERTCAAARSFRTLRVLPEHWVTTSSVGGILAWGMPALTELDLSGCDLSHEGALLLAGLPTSLADDFPDYTEPRPFERGQLSRLWLHGCAFGDEDARTLLAAKHLDRLQELDLGRCGLTEKATLTALREAPGLQHLDRLSLSGNQLSGSFDALTGWKTLERLSALKLPQVTTATDLGALFPRPSTFLRELDVRSAKALVETPQALVNAAEHYTSLDLGTTSLGDDAWLLLLGARSTKSLLRLHANGCSLSDRAIEAVVNSPLNRLVTLDVSSNKLSDAGLLALSQWGGLSRLAELRIGNNRKLTAKGYAALTNASGFRPASLDVGKLTNQPLIARLRERFGDALRVG